MCGIIGIIKRAPCDAATEVRRGLKALRHRGPDGIGLWTGEAVGRGEHYRVGLGHVRLAVQDPSERGHQPMLSEGGEVLCFNGEIYNFLELRRELEALGARFSSDSDSEVLLAAFRHWGVGCVERFVGMWAFALWDGRRLFLSRDRLGKKPLYYFHDAGGGMLAFASEIRGLGELEGVPWKADERRVFRYLRFAEMERDGDTFFCGIREFPAACSAVYRPGEPALEIRRYWGLTDRCLDVGEAEAIERTRTLLHESLALRLRSDVPLGLSLSGGLDSTLLLGLLSEAGRKDLRIYSLGYDHPKYDERRYIALAGQGGGAAGLPVDSSASLFEEEFRQFVHHLDQPSKLPGPYSQWRVARTAAGEVKVLLDGQGADELAGGYLYFLPLWWRSATPWQRVLHAPDILLTLLRNRQGLAQYPPRLLLERARGQAGTGAPPFLQGEWARRFHEERPFWEQQSDLNGALRSATCRDSLPPLLRYGDRVSMAFGVENRSPFLDHRLVEYVAALPESMKIRGGRTKWIFREVARGRVPEPIRARRSKMGFPTPVGEWLRKELRQSARGWLEEFGELPLYRRWIDPEAARTILEAHQAGRVDHQALLWRLLSLGAWLQASGLASAGEETR